MNINEMMKQAKLMQAEIEKKKQLLNSQEFTFTKQGIELVMTGDRQLKSIKLHPALVDPEDPETLEDLIVVALNEALDEINQAHEHIGPKAPGM